MRKTAVILVPALLAGCATIFDGSSKAVTIGSNPDGAEFSIANRAGRVVHSGRTPDRITLDDGASYFVKEKYTLTLKKPGYADTTAELQPHIAGWYFGNLILGGLLGMLVVDPLTGAMYQLPDNFVVPMQQIDAAGTVAAAGTPSAPLVAGTALATMPNDVRWFFQAEKAAAQLNCIHTSYAAQGPGVEFYTAQCNGAQIAIRCDFGHCLQQL